MGLQGVGTQIKSTTVAELEVGHLQLGAHTLSVAITRYTSQALSGEQALRDIERVKFASLILDSQPGQR